MAMTLTTWSNEELEKLAQKYNLNENELQMIEKYELSEGVIQQLVNTRNSHNRAEIKPPRPWTIREFCSEEEIAKYYKQAKGKVAEGEVTEP